MEPVGYGWNNIGWEDIENDKAMWLLHQFVQRCNARPPLQKNDKTPYSHNTVADVVGAVARKLHDRFRDKIGDNINAFFPDDEVKSLKTRVKAAHKRNMCEDGDDTFKGTFPIPREVNNRTVVFGPDNLPEAQRREAEGTVIDMVHISKHLFNAAQFSKLLKLLITFNGIGRGGEVKFLSYSSMFLDQFYNVLFLQWFQRKTLKSNPSGFVPDFVYSTLCVFFAFGCYWACDKGLHRPGGLGEAGSPRYRKTHFVFQDLHEIRDDGVAEQISRIVRSYIPASIREYFTGKSLRVGAMSLLTWDPAVTYEEAVALGGWATPSNRDWYVWQYLIAIIPSVLCLAGYPDVRLLPTLPTLKTLEENPELNEEDVLSANIADKLVDELFHLNQPDMVPSFLKNYNTGQAGKHRSFARCVCAVMIMHFEEHYEKHQSRHAFTQAMINAVVRSGHERGRHWPDAIALLQKWGVLIKRRFRDGSVSGDNLLGRKSIPEQLEKLNESVAKLLRNRTDAMEQTARNTNAINRQSEEIRSLNIRVSAMTEFMKVLVHQNRNLQFRMNELMLHMNVRMEPLPEIPVTATHTQTVVDALMGQAVSAETLAALLGSPVTMGQAATTNRSTAAARIPTTTATTNAGTINATENPINESNATRLVTPAQIRPRNAFASLMRPKANTTKGVKGKGNTEKNQALENVLYFMYTHNNGSAFVALGSGRNGKLTEQRVDAWHSIFNADERMKVQLDKSLKLVDALWTEEERQKCIKKELTNPMDFFMALANRCKHAAWYIKLFHGYDMHNEKRKNGKEMPPWEWPSINGPTTQAKTQVQGLGNSVGMMFKIDDYVPNWGENSKRINQKSQYPLSQWVEINEKKLENCAVQSLCQNA
jgi:hypothetical protein